MPSTGQQTENPSIGAGVSPYSNNFAPRTSATLTAVFLLLMTATLSWRRAQYFSGQLDIVVIGKSALLVFALLIAIWAYNRTRYLRSSTYRVPAPAFVIIALYLSFSAIASMLHASSLSSVSLALRAIISAFVIITLFHIADPLLIISAMARVMAVIVVMIAVTGTIDEGRLAGRIPPISPNEIAFLASVSMLYFAWRFINVRASVVNGLSSVVLAIILLLTQSRSGILLAGVALCYILIRGRGDAAVKTIAVCLALCGALYVALFTNLLYDFGSRGDSASLRTVGTRTIAWQAVINTPRSMPETLFGKGLATKKVAVSGQFWTSQILDSSWISAFVQAGIIGLAIMVALLAYVAIQAVKSARPLADLYVALVIFIMARSVTESGLLDTSTSFIVLMVVAIGAATTNQNKAVVTPLHRIVSVKRGKVTAIRYGM